MAYQIVFYKKIKSVKNAGLLSIWLTLYFFVK